MKILQSPSPLASAKVVCQYINEIIKNRGFSAEQIAESCRIPTVEIFNILANKNDDVTSVLFEKILRFYCAVFYAPALIPCRNNNQPRHRGHR